MNQRAKDSCDKNTGNNLVSQNLKTVACETPGAAHEITVNKYPRRNSPERVINDGLGQTIARHYNELEERGRKYREGSRIYFMRNFNNWTKSMLIHEYSEKIKNERRELNIPTERREYQNIFNVMDLGCGKGGDLMKWSKAFVHNLSCVDIAEQSIRQAKQRYQEMKERSKKKMFEANFWALDCTKVTLRDVYPTNAYPFDIVSCQFALHYAFESKSQAECMIKNAAECLRPGGYFIGTTVDAEEVWKRLHNNKLNDSSSTDKVSKFGNSVYSIEFDESSPVIHALNTELDRDCQSKISGTLPESIPRYGAQYTFHLAGVVDCPEFLVSFDELNHLAEKNDLILVAKQGFENFFKSKRKTKEGNHLLGVIKALERYHPNDGNRLLGHATDNNYDAAEEYVQKLRLMSGQNPLYGSCVNSGLNCTIQPDKEPAWLLADRNSKNRYVGTLSREEWEAVTLYCIFAFRKKEHTPE